MRKILDMILIVLIIAGLFTINISAVPIGATIADLFDSTLATDHSYSGLTLTLTAGETVVFGDILYFNFTDKEVKKADADAAATMPAVCIALEGKDDGQAILVLIFGYIRDDTYNFTATNVYVSDGTAGTTQSTAPADSGDQVQRIGFAFHADKMFFCPSTDVGEI